MKRCRITRTACAAAIAVAPLLLAGCAVRGAGVGLLNLIGLSEKPLVISYVALQTPQTESLNPFVALNPFTATEGFHAAMSRSLHRRATPYLCLPFQLEFDLSLGVCHLAVISPVEFAGFRERGKFTVLAASTDGAGRAARSALLIVPRESPISRVEDLREKVVAFGSRRSPRTLHAALLLLGEHGVAQKDLALELFPVPGSLRMFDSDAEIAAAVLRSQVEAGFVDEAYWESLAEDAAGDGAAPARAKFRVVERTIALPDRLVVASPRMSKDDCRRVADFLLAVGHEDAASLKPMQVAGFAAAAQPMLDDVARLGTVRIGPELPRIGE